MFLRKAFAKKALKSEETLNAVKSGPVIFASLLAGALIGVPASFTLERDPGNEHQDQIYFQYSETLTLLEQAREEYNTEHMDYMPSHLDNDGETADITQSFENEFSQVFSFFTDDDEERDAAENDWNALKHFAGVYAHDLHTDDKLAEADAEKLIKRFQDNVMPFTELGYQKAPDADDLRECQAIYPNNDDLINHCSVETDYADGDEILKYSAASMLLMFLLINGTAAGASSLIRRNRKRLEDWSEGKKSSGFRH